jgi:hypothetical protein
MTTDKIETAIIALGRGPGGSPVAIAQCGIPVLALHVGSLRL